MLKRIFVLATLLVGILSFKVTAQVAPTIEWGVPSAQDLFLKTVDYDTSAIAVVLFDKVTYYPDPREGITTTRHCRIKILKPQAIDRFGNREFVYYSKDDQEVVHSIRAQTINPVGNDFKYDVEVLKGKDFYTTALDKEYSQLKFAFPKVHVGSILEFEISTESKNITFPDKWKFQTSIPTLYSELNFVNAPELQYRFVMFGKHLCAKYGSMEESRKWVLENLPALVDDDYLPNSADFTERMVFQLDKTSYGGVVLKDWREIQTDLLSNYKDYIKPTKEMKSLVGEIVKNPSDTLGSIADIYKFIMKSYDWNDEYSFMPDQSYSKFVEKRRGNSAEKNLLLVGMLRAYGLEADPAILSTRHHGSVYKGVPMLSDYNDVVAVLDYRKEPMVIDAVSRNRSVEFVGPELLNVSAYRLSRKNSGWIEIKQKVRSAILYQSNIRFEKNHLCGDLTISMKGYYSTRMIDDYRKKKKNEFASSLIGLQNMNIDSVSVENENDFSKNFQVKIYFTSIDEFNLGGEIQLPLLMNLPFSKNPFTSSNREVPVYISYPFEHIYNCTIKLPEGYKLDDASLSCRHAISNLDTFRIGVNNNESSHELLITSSLKINTIYYDVDKYEILQNFFQNIVSKSSKIITLKKM